MPPPQSKFQKFNIKLRETKCSDFCTVWLKWIAHFAVGILLLHHYKSGLAYLSDFYSLVIVMYKSEI